MRFSTTVAAISVNAASALRLFAPQIRHYAGKSGRVVLRSTTLAQEETTETITRNFITNVIESDLKENRNGGRVVTRFPPEPNGYLHLGHAKSICFNFGVAKQYNGVTHMRFDDTNPAKEELEYVNSILEDVRWLVGSSEADPWGGPVRHASDYFQTLYDSAEYLIKNGLAYVDNLSPEEMKKYRGTLTESGKDSPYRTRTIEENLQLFEGMRDGTFPDGHCVLRAKIDMSSPNMNLRDPTLYRIKRASHPITGDKWCIYPMYDFAHAISDAIEGITHSLCTLEFADHRPLYDWTIDSLQPSGLLPFSAQGWRPVQTEFSRLNLQYTVLSKRKLIQLVTEKHVNGWDDPRMPTISGIRRRGYPSAALRLFCDRVGISKAENNIDISVLEDCVRETLDADAPRALAIARPLRVTITNYPTEKEEIFTADKHPKKAELGNREIPFTGSVFIDRDDFFDTGIDGSIPPPKGFKRLLPGGTVRLKYAYVVSCDEVIRDPETGEAIELKCSYDEFTRSGATPEGAKKAKGIIQWVSEKHAVKANLALFDRLFTTSSPGKDQPDGDFLNDLNPNSLELLEGALLEPSLVNCAPGSTFQFERLGYFCLDAVTNTASRRAHGEPMVFNRVVTLKDTWAAAEQASSASDAAGSSNSNKVAADKVAAKADKAAKESTEDVLRVELRVGKILSAERHPDADSLYVEKIDLGEATGPRTVISGLAKYMTAESLVGRKVVVVCNLKPSKMRGILSEGMVLAASSAEGAETVEVLEAPADAEVGELVTVEGMAPPTPDEQLKSKTALDAFKRVSAALLTNEAGEGTYAHTPVDGGPAVQRRLVTKAGPCAVATLKGAAIR